MIEMPLDFVGLMEFNDSQGRGGVCDEDLGYTLHGWIAATFVRGAFLSFRVKETLSGLRFYGYSSQPLAVLRRHAEIHATPLALSVARFDRTYEKPVLAEFPAGEVLGFEVRACPVSRGERERDVFDVEVERATSRGEIQPDRNMVYTSWLAKRLADSGCIDLDKSLLDVSGFRIAMSLRQKPAGEHARRQSVRVPDVLYTGKLCVRDGRGFHDLLQRGIGRHRSFGFGMLMLRN